MADEPKLYFLDKQLDGHLVRMLWDWRDDEFQDGYGLLPPVHWLTKTFANCRDNLTSARCEVVLENFRDLLKKLEKNEKRIREEWEEYPFDSLINETKTIIAATEAASKKTTYVCVWIYGDEESEKLLMKTLAGLPSLDAQGELLSASYKFYDFFAPI